MRQEIFESHELYSTSVVLTTLLWVCFIHSSTLCNKTREIVHLSQWFWVHLSILDEQNVWYFTHSHTPLQSVLIKNNCADIPSRNYLLDILHLASSVYLDVVWPNLNSAKLLRSFRRKILYWIIQLHECAKGKILLAKSISVISIK